MFLKNLFKKLFRLLGYRLVKLRPPSRPSPFGKKDLDSLKALNDSKGVLHLGAHRGTEAEVYNWFGKKVIWFEAIPYIYDQLRENIQVYSDQICICALLGNEDGIRKNFYISNNDSASSSIFNFSKNTLNGKYFTNRVLEMKKKISLPMKRLDTILKDQKISADEYDHWVIDLQGAELLALKGSEKSLQYCKSMLVEISTVDIYDGGVVWDELCDWLEKKNFYPNSKPEKNHADVLFIKK
jgi:FkbM family methyltransferase